MFNQWLPVGIRDLAGDHTAANEREVDVFNLFVFADVYGLPRGPLISGAT